MLDRDNDVAFFMPLLNVAMRFDEFVEATRAGFGVGKLRPAGMLLPERAHSLFEFGILF